MIRSEATQGGPGRPLPSAPLWLSRSDWGLNIRFGAKRRKGSGETAPQCPLGLSRSGWGLNIRYGAKRRKGSGETAPQRPLGLSRSDWGLNINRILISVERAASGHVVNPVLYALKDFGIFLGPFCRDSVDNVGVLGDGGEDGVDELDDVNHVLLNKAA